MEINQKMLQALKDLSEAQKIQMQMLNDLKEYVEKRDALYEQQNRAVIDLLSKLAKIK